MSYTGVHQLVRYRLKAKLKVPRPVHIKQKEGAAENFKKADATPRRRQAQDKGFSRMYAHQEN